MRGSLFLRFADYAARVEEDGARRAFSARRIATLRELEASAWYPEQRFRNAARTLFLDSDSDFATELGRFATWLAEHDVKEMSGLSGIGVSGVLAMLPHFYGRYSDRGGPKLRAIGHGYARVEFGHLRSTDHDASIHAACAGVRAWLEAALATAGAERIRIEATCSRSLTVEWSERDAGALVLVGAKHSVPAEAVLLDMPRGSFVPTHVAFSEHDGATIRFEGVLHTQADSAAEVAEMTPSERDVLEGLLAGASDADIAARRSSSTKTVSNQVRSIFRKLGVRSRRELCARFGSSRQ